MEAKTNMSRTKAFSEKLSGIKKRAQDIGLNWAQLDSIRQMKIISSMYIWIFLVPVAAKILSMTSDVATVKVFSYEFQVHLLLPFSWQVFYFSALFFAFATIMYQARCPRIIKEYPTYASFEAEGKPEWHLRDYAQDIGLDYYKYKEEFEIEMENHEGGVSEGKEFTQSLFWHIHWKADRARKTEFSICLSAYVIGFVLIGWVFIQNFTWVLGNILG